MANANPRDISEYRLLVHDTADQIFRILWPPTRPGFIDSFITPYADSAADAYCLCVNCSGTLMFYDSDAGEMYGRDRSYFYAPSALRQHEVIKQLCVTGDAPPRVAVEAARAVTVTPMFLQILLVTLRLPRSLASADHW